MVCAPVRSIMPSLKLGDYLSAQAHNPCSISHLYKKHRKFKAAWSEDYNQGRTSVPGVCNYGYVPPSHLGNIVMRTESTTDLLT